ncbi:MAG: hypothetical protein E6Q51_00945 [Methylophilus methylotrophus]|uniref:Uncharacterized protein n=1 Tax=Methylophilus methylotrophus TaxID=17 RepID=A0A5C7WNU6_METME|nr:MAG: hypothetical protein E6Q51_00945 [Methylophilus methylotrophus]
MTKKRKKSTSIPHVNPVQGVVPAQAHPRHVLFLLALLTVQCLLLLWALAHHFIPSAAWQSAGFYCNLLISAMVTGTFYCLMWRQRKADLSRYKQLFLIVFSPILLYFLGYFSLIYGAGDVYTQLTGMPASIEDHWQKNSDDAARFEQEYIAAGVYEKRYFDHRKGCITRLSSPMLAQGFPVYFCVAGRTFASLPLEVPVTMHGLQSQAGFDLQHVDYQR